MKITFIFLFLNTILLSNIIHVPSDSTSIQAGINGANDGDTVLVQPGTYIENINFYGKNIVVGSLTLTTGDTSYISQTIIDGDSSGSVVSFINGESREAILNGFTITNGSGTDSLYQYNILGGGLVIYQSNPTIRNLNISNNTGDLGGGIFCHEARPLIEKVVIHSNYAGGDGGGISCRNGSRPVLKDVIINNNYAGYGGGGIRSLQGGKLVLVNVLIYDNVAGYGNAINSWNSIFYLYNCTITGHQGGNGIWVRGNSKIYVYNSILWNPQSQFEFEFMEDGIPSYIYSTHSNIRGGLDGIPVDSASTIDWASGNLNIDPSFVDTLNGDFHLQSNSPCLNVGHPNTFFNDYDFSRCDMGYYGGGGLIPYFLEFQFDTLSIGELDTVWFNIFNLQDQFFIVDSISLSDNINFSLYENTQIEISPFTKHWIPIVFHPQVEDSLLCTVSFYSEDFLGVDNADIEIKGVGEGYVNIDENISLPKDFYLYQNYPNPFNPTTKIHYNILEKSHINITIYNLLGKKVKTLVNQIQESGYKSILWDATNTNGQSVSAGIYLYQIQVGNFTKTRKMVLIR